MKKKTLCPKKRGRRVLLEKQKRKKKDLQERPRTEHSVL